MAYNEEKLTKLKALKQLAQRIEAEYATKKSMSELSERVDGLITAGGEPNAINAIKVNGVAQAIADKAVDLTVPTKVSDLDNDSKFQTEEQVAAKVAAADHLKRKIVENTDAIDPEADDADQYIYMVRKSSAKSGDKYDEYMVLDGTLEKVGDWAVDLSGYQPKEEGKGLSANDYTDEEKAKLGGISAAATKVEASETPGNIKIDGEETTVVEIASDTEVSEMLTEVFGEVQAG